MEHTTKGLARSCNSNDLFLSGGGLQCGNCGAWEQNVKAGHFVVVGKWSHDNPQKMYYQIKEFVTPDRLYITLPGIYSTVNSAIAEIERLGG
jgi:hypothetical protein